MLRKSQVECYFCGENHFMNVDFFDRTFLQWIVLAIYLAAVLIEFSYQLFFYVRLLYIKASTGNRPERPVSVCLCVRNEEDRIDQVISQILDQEYGNFELIVVDDYSEDCTLQKIGAWAKKDSRVKFTSISQETRFSEKLAINLALKAATYDQIIFIHADTLQFDPQYLKKVNNLVDDGVLVLNYTNFKVEQTFYNKFCRIERFLMFLKSAAYSSKGVPIFFEENNVLFPRSIYFQSDGFRGKMKNYFANLELIFNKNIKGKTKVSLDPDTYLREDLLIERRNFWELLQKQIRIKQQLKFSKRLVLTIENITRIIFLAGLLTLLVTEIKGWAFILLPALIVLALQFFIIKSMVGRLNEKKIFLSSFAYVFVRPVLQMYIASKIYIIDKRNKWN